MCQNVTDIRLDTLVTLYKKILRILRYWVLKFWFKPGLVTSLKMFVFFLYRTSARYCLGYCYILVNGTCEPHKARDVTRPTIMVKRLGSRGDLFWKMENWFSEQPDNCQCFGCVGFARNPTAWLSQHQPKVKVGQSLYVGDISFGPHTYDVIMKYTSIILPASTDTLQARSHAKIPGVQNCLQWSPQGRATTIVKLYKHRGLVRV